MVSEFDMGFGAFNITFIIIFIIVIGAVIAVAVTGLSRWSKNNSSPVLTVEAAVKSKRTSTTHQHHANAGDVSGAHGFHITSTTWRYVTFEVDSGDIVLEFTVSAEEYAALTEGDRGRLTFQGTRYLGFERNP